MPLILALALQEDFAKLARDIVAKDEAARAKVLKMGSAAIRPLLAERSRHGTALDAFLYELKKASDPVEAHAKVYESLEKKISFEERTASVAEISGSLTTEVKILVDPGVPAKDVKFAAKEMPLRDALDALARGAGLEFAVRYGVVLISTPDRLWTLPPKPVRELDEKERAEVASLIEELGDDSLDVRDAADKKLRSIGPGARSLLDAASTGEGEAAARCRAILQAWDRKEEPAFPERCGVDRQTLTGEDAKLVDRLRSRDMTIKTAELPLSTILKLLMSACDLVYDTEVSTEGVQLSVSFESVPSYAILAILTRPFGFDFYVREGVIRIDTAEEVRKKVR